MDKIVITERKVHTNRYCEECGKVTHVYLVRVITSNGIAQVYWYCQRHDGAINLPRKNIPHDAIKAQGIDINKLEVIGNNSLEFICARCGHVGAANHHWAPRHLFGVECEQWPQGLLCEACHKKWHDIVTPDMGKRNK